MRPRAASEGRRPPWFHLVVGLALALQGLGLLLVSSAIGADRPEVVEGNVPVNGASVGQRDIRAHNSPTIARSPIDHDNLAAVSRIDTPRFSCALYVSTDAGARWEPVGIPFPPGEEQPPRCFAPDLGFGPDGTLYVSFVTLRGLGNVPNAAWLTSARPGTTVLSAPVRVSGPFAFQLRLAVSSTPGRLYLSWVQAEQAPKLLGFSGPGNPVVVSRSDDGGRTWSEPVPASPRRRGRVLAPSPVVGPGDDLYVLYVDVGDDVLDYEAAHEGVGGDPYPGTWALVLARSQDGGRTWRESVVDDGVVPTERFVAFFPPFPSLALAPGADRVYAAFHDRRLGDADVHLWVSDDGGATFSAPRRINDTRRGDGTAQYLPKVDVAPDGRVDVVYYDRRADPDNVMNEVSLQSSPDGTSFGARLRLSDRAFDSRIGFGSESGMPDLGSRLGLASTADEAVAVWSDTRAGTVASNKQDLALAVVAFPGRSGTTLLFRLGAVVLLVVAALMLAAWARARGPRGGGAVPVGERKTGRRRRTRRR